MANISLTEDNLENCAVALYEELPQGHTVVEEANASQHSFQLVTCSGQICYNWTTPDGIIYGWYYIWILPLGLAQ